MTTRRNNLEGWSYDEAAEAKLHGIKVNRMGNTFTVRDEHFCPIYVVTGTENRVLIDDEEFVHDDELDAAKVAMLRITDTRLSGLNWTKKVGRVTLKGIRSIRARVGPFDVLCYAGPAFEQAVANDQIAEQARRARGLPTGLPGDRKIIVKDFTQL